MSNFDDPVLKQAVRRAWGDEKAPAGLAARCRAAMAEELSGPLHLNQPDTGLNTRMWGHARSWGGWAMAALVLLTVGLGYLYFAGPPSRSNAVLAGGIPVSLIEDVIATHDHCSSRYLANHHNVGCPKTDYPQIKQTLEQRLGHRVLVTPVAGWEFRGAADCATAGSHKQCAHLLFERPDRKQTLSVFSMPYEGECTLRPAEVFAEQIERHPVAGFVEGQEIYCLVGYAPDGSLTVAEVKTVTETYRQNLHAIRIVYPDTPADPTRLVSHPARR